MSADRRELADRLEVVVSAANKACYAGEEHMEPAFLCDGGESSIKLTEFVLEHSRAILDSLRSPSAQSEAVAWMNPADIREFQSLRECFDEPVGGAVIKISKQRQYTMPVFAAPVPAASPDGCPCLLVEPCRDSCSCANPTMSGGCARCAKYGSVEQRLKAALRLSTAKPEPAQVEAQPGYTAGLEDTYPTWQQGYNAGTANTLEAAAKIAEQYAVHLPSQIAEEIRALATQPAHPQDESVRVTAIKGIGLVRMFKEQRDEVSDVLRRVMAKLREDSGDDLMEPFSYDAVWEHLAIEADAILAKCPSYDLQLDRICAEVGITRQQLTDRLAAPQQSPKPDAEQWQCKRADYRCINLRECQAPDECKEQARAKDGFGYRVYRDGDEWCAVRSDFINLQESPAEFDKLPHVALRKLILAEGE